MYEIYVLLIISRVVRLSIPRPSPFTNIAFIMFDQAIDRTNINGRFEMERPSIYGDTNTIIKTIINVLVYVSMPNLRIPFSE